MHFNEKQNGLCQKRLTQAICKLLLQCMDFWTLDKANATAATYIYRGNAGRHHIRMYFDSIPSVLHRIHEYFCIIYSLLSLGRHLSMSS